MSGETILSLWKRVLDMKEVKKQALFSLPMIFTNLFYFAIPLISTMFAGHIGHLQFAGATLANSWALVTGFVFMTGLSGALETLCGQGYGAKQFRMLGIYLQSSCIVSLFFSVVISIFWFYSKPVFILIHQDPQISQQAALYVKHLIPALFAYGFLQNMLRFLQTQSIVMPQVFLSALPLGMHLGVAYALVHHTSLGYRGAALATSVSLWISTLLLATYVLCAKRIEHTWQGFSLQSFSFICTYLKLALPSAAMGCLVSFSFEILVFLAGMMSNSDLTTSLIGICINTEAITYMITFGLSAVVSTRVSNELGAGNIGRAKNAMAVTLKLLVLIAPSFLLALAFGHKAWVSSFTDSPEIIKMFASLTPFLMISIIFDSLQAVLSGVARGCGWQHLAMWVNLATLYLIGLPTSLLLGFKLKLQAKGLWIGLICGLASQGSTLVLIILRRNWIKMNIPVSKSENEPSIA